MDPGQEGADEEWRPSKQSDRERNALDLERRNKERAAANDDEMFSKYQPKDGPGAGLLIALAVIVLVAVFGVLLVQCSQGWQHFT